MLRVMEHHQRSHEGPGPHSEQAGCYSSKTGEQLGSGVVRQYSIESNRECTRNQTLRHLGQQPVFARQDFWPKSVEMCPPFWNPGYATVREPSTPGLSSHLHTQVHASASFFCLMFTLHEHLSILNKVALSIGRHLNVLSFSRVLDEAVLRQHFCLIPVVLGSILSCIQAEQVLFPSHITI